MSFEGDSLKITAAKLVRANDRSKSRHEISGISEYSTSNEAMAVVVRRKRGSEDYSCDDHGLAEAATESSSPRSYAFVYPFQQKRKMFSSAPVMRIALGGVKVRREKD